MKTIPLTQGQVAFVDEQDFESLNAYTWHALRRKHGFYAGRNAPHQIRPKAIAMHRQIMGFPEGEVDHRNGNGLDNRRENLRCVGNYNPRAYKAKAEGKSSRFRGVRWHRVRKKWSAQIGVDYKSIYLGLFPSEEAAAGAYDEAALEFFGELASLNFPRVNATPKPPVDVPTH